MPTSGRLHFTRAYDACGKRNKAGRHFAVHLLWRTYCAAPVPSGSSIARRPLQFCIMRAVLCISGADGWLAAWKASVSRRGQARHAASLQPALLRAVASPILRSSLWRGAQNSILRCVRFADWRFAGQTRLQTVAKTAAPLRACQRAGKTLRAGERRAFPAVGRRAAAVAGETPHLLRDHRLLLYSFPLPAPPAILRAPAAIYYHSGRCGSVQRMFWYGCGGRVAHAAARLFRSVAILVYRSAWRHSPSGSYPGLAFGCS